MVSVADRATGPDRGGPGDLDGLRESAGLRDSADAIPSIVACPECGLPAEITDRFSLRSTEGPVEHVALGCVDGHHFRMPVDGLSPEARPLAGGSDSAADTRHARSATNAQAGFSRMPGRLGTVANADSGTEHF